MSIIDFENRYTKLVKDFDLATLSPDEVVKIICNLSTRQIEGYVVTTLDDFLEHAEEYVDSLRNSSFEV